MFEHVTRVGSRAAPLLAATIAAIPAMAWSQAAPQPQQLERVEITGSSIKRIDAETALPVQVITREQIQRTGATNVEQLLQTISSVSSSGGLVTASASGAATGSISAVSLHGLTSIRTLVLLNGRRVAPYGIGFTGDSVSVDVNSIPLAAIERVEVLKDGASAVYGSDAIAGVINFILRQDFKGIEIGAEYGDTTQGGANFKRATAAFGLGNLAADRYNVMVVASYQKEGALFGRDRGFAQRGIRPYEGQDGGSSGNTFPGNVALLDGSGTLNPLAPGCPGPYSVNDAFFPPTRCRFDPSPLVTLVPESKRESLFASARFAITPDVQLFAEGSYNRNQTRTVIQPVPLSDQFVLPSTNPLCTQAPYNNTVDGSCVSTFLLQPSSPYYPTAFAAANYGGAPDLLVRYRSVGTHNRDITDISQSPRAVAGVKGTVRGWDFDAAYLYSQSKVREQVNDGYPANSLVLPLLNSGNVNPFGPNTPEIDAALAATNFIGDAFTIRSTLQSVTARAASDIAQLSAGPLGVAFGVEGRREELQFRASPTIQTGDISGYGGNFLDTDRSRDVGALFAEVNVPVVRHVEANVAVRYDHYQGIGNSTTPKASLRWQPIPQVLLRASWGKGFRAPSLQDLYLPNTTGVTNAGLNDPLRCPVTNDGTKDCSTQFPTTNGGNAQLKPEKSRNFTLGTVLEPVSGVSVGIDYFRVYLRDTIVNGIDSATTLSDPVKYAPLITRATPSAADVAAGIPGPITNILQTNLNLGATKISGIDLDVRWRIPAGDLGRFTISGSGTYFSRFDAQNLDGSYSGGVDLVNPATGGVVPRFKSYLSLDWQRGPWDVNVAQNFQKGYQDLPGSATGAPRDVGSYTTFDLQSTYSGFKGWRLTLGARNVFDKDPPYSNVGGVTQFQAGYDAQYADPRGRFVYGRVTWMLQ